MNVTYRTKEKMLEATCYNCGYTARIPCTPEQYREFKEGGRPYIIFDDTDPNDIGMLLPTVWCDVCCYDNYDSFLKATKKMNEDASRIFSSLFPEEEPVNSVYELWMRYKELGGHHFRTVGFMINDDRKRLDEIHKSLLGFIELIEKSEIIN